MLAVRRWFRSVLVIRLCLSQNEIVLIAALLSRDHREADKLESENAGAFETKRGGEHWNVCEKVR